MLQLGLLNKLIVKRQTPAGFFLSDNESNEVLLPNRFAPAEIAVNDEVDVFLYKDSEGTIIATKQTPKLMLFEYALLTAKTVTSHGAFFDWGLEKDLMVPFSRQACPIEEGEDYIVYMYLDEETERLTGSTKISDTLDIFITDIEIGDEVSLLAYQETMLGISVIVNNKYQGILYRNEVFQKVNMGDRLTGYVKKIRTDHKLDISLNRFGYKAVDDNTKLLWEKLISNNGRLDLNDKSSPEDIYNELGMSKKIFKKAIGSLYKQKLIEITENGIISVSGKQE